MFKKFINKIYTILVYVNYYFTKKKINKFIFIHPPQSGGNTLDFYFKINFGLRNHKIMNHFSYKNFNFSAKELNKIFLIYGHFPYEFALRNGYNKNFFYFTSIRDPKQRYLSNYYRNKRDFEKCNKKYISLEDFLKLRFTEGQDNFYVRFFSSKNIHRNPAIKINNEHVNDSVESLKKLDFIFHINDMEKNLLSFKKKLKIIIDMTNFFQLHKNKVSNSTYPRLSLKEIELLEKLTLYDNKLYEEIKKIKK